MQRAVFEEDRLDESGVDRGEEAFSGVLVGGEVRRTLDGDEGPRLLARHIHTRKDYGSDIVLFLLLLS